MERSDFTNNRFSDVDSLRPLRCFVAVAEELHFGRAAERLILPQSTISEQVRKLESVLGGELFVRTSRSVSLSPLGAILLPEAKRSLNAVRHAYELTSTAARTGNVPLLLGIAVDVDSGELARAFPLLRAEMPNMKIVPTPLATGQQIEMILERRLHIGFVWEPPATEHLDEQLVGYTGMIAMVPFDHPLAGRAKLTPKEVCAHSLVLFSPVQNVWVRQRFDAICREENVLPLVAAEGVGYEGQVPLVLAGAGIGITAASIKRGWRRCLLWHEDETHPGVKALRRIVRRK
jgi:DNA-binding transcriptional LysR family regulator